MTGAINNSLKELRKQYKERGVFYTDSKLAEFLKSFIPDDVKEVYDPTCGSGNLLAVFPDNVKKFGQEIDAGQAQVAAERLINADIATGDTLQEPAFWGRKFRAIVSNYPFSIKWTWPALPDERFSTAPVMPPTGKADYAFLLHIIHYLRDDGVATVLCFPGVTYRGQREGTLRRWMVETLNVIDKVIAVDGGYFEDTKIPTTLIVFRKDRQKGASITMGTYPDERTAEVTIEDIRANDFNLSPQIYLVNHTPSPFVDFDPVEHERKLRALTLDSLRHSLDLSLMTSDINGVELGSFLDQLQGLVDEYRQKITSKYNNYNDYETENQD